MSTRPIPLDAFLAVCHFYLTRAHSVLPGCPHVMSSLRERRLAAQPRRTARAESVADESEKTPRSPNVAADVQQAQQVGVSRDNSSSPTLVGYLDQSVRSGLSVLLAMLFSLRLALNVIFQRSLTRRVLCCWSSPGSLTPVPPLSTSSIMRVNGPSGARLEKLQKRLIKKVSVNHLVSPATT